LLLKAFVGFLVGGGLLAGAWQPAALAAGIVVVVWLWGRVKAILLLGSKRENG
jgi:hypothetical protein